MTAGATSRAEAADTGEADSGVPLGCMPPPLPQGVATP